MLQFSLRTQERAKRAWKCSPFTQVLFEDLRQKGVPLGQITGQAGCRAGYTWQALSEQQAAADLMWLIQVGVLRREVDGQGITDSYRLAPLGHQILGQMQTRQARPQPTLLERLLDHLTRWGVLRSWT